MNIELTSLLLHLLVVSGVEVVAVLQPTVVAQVARTIYRCYSVCLHLVFGEALLHATANEVLAPFG